MAGKMNVYNEMVKAQLESISSDPTGIIGMVYFNTTSNISKYYNGSAWKTFLAADFSNVTGTLAVANGGTGVTTSTGSGNVVLSTSPTLVTPVLGTPSSATLTNATGLPIDGGTVNTLPVSRGGTGQTTATAAFNSLSPTTTIGDISYHNGTDDVRLPIGANGLALTVAGGVPTWAAVTPSLDSTEEMTNLGFAASVGSGALTIALKDKAGSDPSGGSPVKIAFRNSTATNGTYNVRSVTSALSVVVSSGSTLGHASATQNPIYLYAIDNAGTVELAVSTSFIDCNTLQTTVAEGGSGAADSATDLYSTTARSNVPIRLIGRMLSTQTTAGTWAVVPTESASGNTLGLATATQSGLLQPVTNQADAIATQMGNKQYIVGMTYNSIPLNVSGVSVSRGVIIPYQMQGGEWRCKFNISGTTGSTQGATATIDGISFKTGYNQAFTLSQNTSSSNAISIGYTIPTTGGLLFRVAGGVAPAAATDWHFSGDVELNAKPTWAY